MSCLYVYTYAEFSKEGLSATIIHLINTSNCLWLLLCRIMILSPSAVTTQKAKLQTLLVIHLGNFTI